jgi:hypothetical protein
MNSLLLSLALMTPSQSDGPFIVTTTPTNAGVTFPIVLPPDRHLRNVGGSDGAGLCVFASISHASDWHVCPLIGIFNWMRQHPGGSWPEKTDKMVERYCKEKGEPVPPYLQITNGDVETLKVAIANGFYPCVTYAGYDGKFYNSKIAHMVNLVYLSNEWAVIHDNNYPGRWLWMKPSAFIRRWNDNSGGWAFILLNSGSPFFHFVQNLKEGVTLNQFTESLSGDWRKQDNGLYVLHENGKVKAGYLPQWGCSYAVEGKTCTDNIVVTESMPENVNANYGIDLDKMKAKTSDYSFNGQPCTREAAFQSLGAASIVGDSIPDISSLPWLVFKVSEESERRSLLSRLNQEFKGKYRIQGYLGSHWQSMRLTDTLSYLKPDGSLVRATSKIGTREEIEAFIAGTKPIDPSRPSPNLEPIQARGIHLWILTGLFFVMTVYLIFKSKG